MIIEGKKMKKLILAAVLCFSGSVFAVLSGGGTQANPLLIQSRADFDEFTNPVYGGIYWASGVYTKLMCDIDLVGTAYTQAVIASSGSYRGIFDGDGHIISNLTIYAGMSMNVGLFGSIGSGGQVRHLGIVNVSVTGRQYVGGMAGWNEGTVNSCYTSGSVNGTSFLGGFVGRNYSGTVIDSYAMTAVQGTGYLGGFAGSNSGMLINCYASGFVSGSSYVGGFAGYNGPFVPTPSPDWARACFWDQQASGQINGVGGGFTVGVTGKTTTEMMTLSTFTDAGWDFSLTDGDAADWMMLRPNEDYPRLAWQTIYPGDIAGLYGVDMADLMEVVNNWLEQECPTSCEQADIDGSGQVDLGDLAILAGNWIEGAI
jgi:hypothetical protein